MAKVKVEVTGAIVDGKFPGEQLEVEEKSADYLEKIGYVKKLGKATTSRTSTKKSTKSTTKK